MPTSYLFLRPYPLLSEIPFVATTICLCIGYFLSDSEALALSKCRTFIYAMEPTERKCVLLTEEQKFQIVSRIEAGCGNCEEDNVSSWLDCDADDAGFQLMSDDEIIAQVRKLNSDDDISESDEDEVIETSKISKSYAFECFSKGLMWLEHQTESDSTERMLLKQFRDRAAKRHQSCLRESKLNVKYVSYVI
ncbi:hypothetical protein AVEN_96067-1 [Araneus ventricosus]|uniref:Uncharacterized protein n=1 Tax=Araneus ventricosus TaxID=182803 RepID=A0A4Y2B3B2_ARAVE|nr:hypothetical protein AVEN_96067-1 [Araneus ventricosus]